MAPTTSLATFSLTTPKPLHTTTTIIMAQLQIVILFVSFAFALSESAPEASNPFIPIYNAISAFPGPLFSHHSKSHTSYDPEAIFHPLDHHKPTIHKPLPIIIDPSTPVYQPEPTKVFHDPEPSYNHEFIHEIKTNDVVHEIKPESKLFHESKHAFKPYHEKPKPYAFDYGVKDSYSGANFGHSQSSDGNEVKGSYTVALPDGRIQRVTYTADEYNGFQAKVTYEGEAKYPKYVANPKPVIHLQKEYSPPEFKLQTEYQPPKFEFTSSPHNHIAHPHPIQEPFLQHHIPPYNPLPTPGVYTLPHS